MGGLVPLESLVGSNFGVGMSGEKPDSGSKPDLGFDLLKPSLLDGREDCQQQYTIFTSFSSCSTLLPVYVQALLL